MLKVQTSTYVIGKEEYNDFGPDCSADLGSLAISAGDLFCFTALEQCIGSPSRIHHPFAQPDEEA